jgi:hypothetical protein
MMGSRARLVSLLLAFLLARAVEVGPLSAAGGGGGGSRYLTKDERWMSQLLDHFSPTVSQLPLPLPVRGWAYGTFSGTAYLGARTRMFYLSAVAHAGRGL